MRVVSTANVDIASAPSAIDGVTLASGDRVLLKDQSTASQNGIYVFDGAGLAIARTVDADTSGEVAYHRDIRVTEGGTHANSRWRFVTNNPITLDMTELRFANKEEPFSSG